MPSLIEQNIAAYEFNKATAEKVDATCAPLFKAFGITHFGFIRIFPGRKLFRIANRQDWTDKYFQHGFYNTLKSRQLGKIPVNGTYHYFLTGLPSGEHAEALFENNIWNFMIIFERLEEYGNFWFFATTRENAQILDFYANNTDLLTHFIYYFKEKNKSILNLKDDNILIHLENDPLEVTFSSDNTIHTFLEQTNISQYLLEIGERKFPISKREMECLFYLCKGNSAKKIASTLDISPRTVEKYIEIIKNKTSSYCKDDLSNFFNYHSFYDIFPQNKIKEKRGIK